MYTSVAPIIGWTVLVAILSLAWIRGGRPERLGAGLVLFAALFAFGAHNLSPVEWQPLLLLADDGFLAMGFLVIALRYASAWLGGAMIFQAVQFSLHAYYFVAERAHDRLYSIINNIDSLGVLACILIGALLAWRKRTRAAK